MSDKFFKLPQDLAARKDLKASDKLVFVVLEDRQGENGYCWPGIRTLAKDTGLTTVTIIECIKRLEAANLLGVERHSSGQSNHYHCKLKSGKETIPVKKTNRLRNYNSGGKETIPEAVKKLNLNQTDQLNETKASAKDFFNFWNLRENLPQIRTFTDERKRKFKVRMKEPLFAENWPQIIDRISASKFCTGKNNRGWRADVDWLLKNSTYYTRVLEGKYDNNGDGTVEVAPFDKGAATQREKMLAAGAK